MSERSYTHRVHLLLGEVGTGLDLSRLSVLLLSDGLLQVLIKLLAQLTLLLLYRLLCRRLYGL